MKRSIIIAIVCLFIVPIIVSAKIEGYEIVSKSAEDRITLYAKNEEDLYWDFKIDFKGAIFSRPFWLNVINPTYAPKIIFQDINKDGEKELTIFLTKGYGTGVLWEEVHVFDQRNDALHEVLVDNPLAIIHKNVKTKLLPNKAVITIGGKTSFVDITSLEIKRTDLFDEISFGSIVDYGVEDNQLIVKLMAQISPASFIGEVVITYEYHDNMYQAKSIEFQGFL